MAHTVPAARVATCLLLALAGCGHGARARASLEQQLRARHAGLLARDPQAVAEQLARMARGSFSFFRGSAGLHPDEPSRFLTADSSQVAVFGDPHPENIGTFRTPRGERVLDFNDFDLAGHGPYLHDLRRLALGLWLTADMADLGRRGRERTVEEMVEGYWAELQSLARGEAPVSLRAESAFGGDLPAILAEGDHPGVETVSPADRALVEEALRAYPPTVLQPASLPPGSLAIKRITRPSTGIASLQLLRFRVRVEGPTPAEDDDWTLELKETPPPAGRAPGPAGVVEPPSAAALVRLQRELQEFPDDDPLLGWAHAGGRDFRVRSAGPEQRRLSAERIARRLASPQWRKKDLRDLAHQCGRLLARGHARARTAAGVPGLPALIAAITDPQGLTRETTSATARAAKVIETDLDHLRVLLKEKGPLLGWHP